MVVGDLEFSTTTTGQPGSAKKKSTLKVVLNGVFLCHCGTNHWVKVTLVYNGKTTRTEDSARRELRKLKNKKAKDCHAKVNFVAHFVIYFYVLIIFILKFTIIE
jgi:hypothetical protein